MIFGTYYCPGDTLCVGVFAVHCVSYSIFIKPTSMSSSPLWSLLSQSLAHLVTMRHCLLQEQRLRRTEFTVRTLKSVTCTCIKPEVLLLLLSPSIPPFFPWKLTAFGIDHMQASLANTDWYTGVSEVEIQRQKNTRPFVHNDPFLSRDISQSKDTVWPVFVRWTLQKGKWQKKPSVWGFFNCFLTPLCQSKKSRI